MFVAERLGDYISSLRYDDVDEKVIHEAKRRVIDTIGCAIGAFDAVPVKISVEIAKNASARQGATILGTKHKTTTELAAFANTTMSRYLDFMDTYFFEGEYVHPEDNIMSLFAVAESNKLKGKDVILSTILAYETCCRFVDFANVRHRGWDHVIYVSISTAAAVSKLLGLSVKQTANALSLAITPNVPLRQTRVGHLSIWKALAVSYAAMGGVFAANLAKDGITGPEESFEGKNGLFSQVTGKHDLSIARFCRSGSGFRIMDVQIKKYPAEINSQSAIAAALKIRDRITSLNEIEKINIYTFTAGYEIIADKEKWQPKNRETADHSLPYIVCAALADGDINERTYSQKRISDPKIHAMIEKVEVFPSKECDKEYYPGTPTIVEIVTKNGETFSTKVVDPRGSKKNPMTDNEIEEKFRALTKKFLTPKQIESGLDLLWNLEKQTNIQKLLASFVVKK